MFLFLLHHNESILDKYPVNVEDNTNTERNESLFVQSQKDSKADHVEDDYSNKVNN